MNQNYKLDYWESKSLALLRKATIKPGIKASCTNRTNYSSIFARDAVMAGIAGIMYGDSKVIDGLKSTVEMLYLSRGAQGQIASNYKFDNNKFERISFGTLSPKIDSATWYLIAVGLLMQKGYQYSLEYVEATVNLLEALEYNGHDLIYIPEGGNWADEYPFEGYILYDQVLRIWALKLLGKQFKKTAWIDKADKIINKVKEKYFNISKGYYSCSYKPSGENITFDFAAHTLLGLLDYTIDNQQFEKSLSWINETFLSKGNLPGAFHPIIHEDSPHWEHFSNFHLFEFRNKPYHFHNGGIWFIWIGWYALTLRKHKRFEELELLAQITFDRLTSIENFDFDEYLSSEDQKPYGTKELCYTATGILFLCNALKNKTENKELL